MKVLLVCFTAGVCLALLAAQPGPELFKLEGDIQRVHDPVIAKCKDVYYLFCTGGRAGAGVIPIRTSKDLKRWTNAGTVFEQLPAWAIQEIPGARGAWAPDISFFNGKYHLYYSVSTFGSRNSAIGLATNRTLDPADPDYRWVDEGMVLRSYEDRDDWNAIDPNLVLDGQDAWLAWGSFWSGIKMRRIDPSTGKFSTTDTTMHSLCSRPRGEPIDGSVEAPFIVRHNGYWYLFVSYDFCCRGAKSTYNVVVGRARRITGPYIDREGKPLMEGGGTKVIEATAGGAWRGPGHQAILQEPGRDYLVFHAYDGVTGIPHLHISTMVWEDGWPRVAALP